MSDNVLIKKVTIVLTIFLLCGNAAAYEFDRALIHLSDDFVQCAAYFSLASSAARKSSSETNEIKNASIERLDKSFEIMTLYSIRSSNQVMVKSQYASYLNKMRNRIKNDDSNIPILLGDYVKLCPEIKDKPFNRMKFWLDKK